MNNGIHIDWGPHPQREWDALATGAALQQHWAYGAAARTQGCSTKRALITQDGRTVALAQFTVRSVAGLADWALCTRGPHWLAPLADERKAEIYRALRETAPLRRPRAIFFSPDETEEGETAACAAGLRRIMTGYSTVSLDLTRSLSELRAALHGKWRNRLRAAEKSELRLQMNGLRPPQYQWLLKREEAQRKHRGYAGLPAELTPRYQAAAGRKGALRILRADLGKSAAAAMLFLIHGKGATYHIGWNSDEGRQLGAHNLLLWTAIRQLKRDGIESLDLGGVNTESGAGVARFKLGAGGQPMTLCGVYF